MGYDKVQAINKGIPSNNTSGVKGVSWSKHVFKWKVFMSIDGVKTTLGEYDIFDEAVNGRYEAELKYHKPLLDKNEII